MPKRTEANRKTNIWVARSVPLLLLGAIGYASWVVTKPICVDYLINPPLSLSSRRQIGSAIAILITFYILLAAMVISYARLLDTVARHPGLIPRGPQWYAEEDRRKNTRSRDSDSTMEEKTSQLDRTDSHMPKDIQKLASNKHLPFKVEEFWQKDIFICKEDGRPAFCSICYNWKPDRSHHCSEQNRCILKFDHFCPWVGGVVSETSFKFFIQFTFYAALYTLETLIVVAYFFAQRRQQSNFVNGHWIAALALAGLFFLFSAGMCVSTAQFAFINSTTIENLNRKTKVWYLAVHISMDTVAEAHDKDVNLRFISFPRPAEEQLKMLADLGARPNDGNDVQLIPVSQASASQRVFAILQTEPGANPFDIGYLGNFQDIMGMTLWDWLMPLHPSPCYKHESSKSLYKMGPVVDDLISSTGLTTWNAKARRSSATKRSRNREEQ